MSSKVDIFDQIAEASPQEDIFDQFAIQGPSAPIPQALKGLAKGAAGTYGDILDLVGLQTQEPLLPGQEALAQEEARAPEEALPFLQEDDVLPRFSRLPTSEEIGALIENLGGPGSPQTAEERFASRIGEALGAGGAFGANVGTLGALGLGALVGQTAEEMGASPLTSLLAELGTTLGTGAFAGRVAPRGREAQQLAAAGRALGLTEQQLSPLVKGRKKFGLATKFARKNEKFQQLAESIESKLGDSYEHIKAAARENPPLNVEQIEGLSSALEKNFDTLIQTHKPNPAKKDAIDVLRTVITDIENAGTNPEKLISTFQDINSYPKKVRDYLTPTRRAITETLKKENPQLGRDFEQANKLNTNFMERIGRLKPAEFDKAINKIEAFGIAGGIGAALLGHPWALKGIATEAGLRTLANQYLTNPYLQNLGNKFLDALVKNKKKTAVAISENFKKYLERNYPEDFSLENLPES